RHDIHRPLGASTMSPRCVERPVLMTRVPSGAAVPCVQHEERAAGDRVLASYTKFATTRTPTRYSPRMKQVPALCTTALAISGLVTAALHAQGTRLPRAVIDPGVVTTRQAISPAGEQTVLDGKVYGVSFGATSDEVWVLVATRSGPAIYQLDWRDNRTIGRWQLQGTAALQGLAFDPKRRSPLVAITRPGPREGDGGVVQLLRRAGDTFVPLADGLGRYLAGSPAIADAASVDRAVVPLVFDDALAVVNRSTGAITSRIKTGGVAPFGAVVSRDG